MSDRVTISLGLDKSEFNIGIDEAMVQLDDVVKAAREARATVMRDVRAAVTAMSSMMTSYSMAMHLLGAQVDSFYAALIGMTLSTISMLLSISAALAATGVGIPAAAIIMGIAVVLNIATIGKLLADKAHQSGLWAEIQRAAQKGVYTHKQTGQVRPTSGGF